MIVRINFEYMQGSAKARREYFASWKEIWTNNMYRYPLRLAIAAGAVGIATIYGEYRIHTRVFLDCLIRNIQYLTCYQTRNKHGQ